jgi:hypothetical protein
MNIQKYQRIINKMRRSRDTGLTEPLARDALRQLRGIIQDRVDAQQAYKIMCVGGADVHIEIDDDLHFLRDIVEHIDAYIGRCKVGGEDGRDA